MWKTALSGPKWDKQTERKFKIAKETDFYSAPKKGIRKRKMGSKPKKKPKTPKRVVKKPKTPSKPTVKPRSESKQRPPTNVPDFNRYIGREKSYAVNNLGKVDFNFHLQPKYDYVEPSKALRRKEQSLQIQNQVSFEASFPKCSHFVRNKP